MRIVEYTCFVSDHEILHTKIPLLEWVKEKIIHELDVHSPHGPITIHRWRDEFIHCTVLKAEAEWKEPIQ